MKRSRLFEVRDGKLFREGNPLNMGMVAVDRYLNRGANAAVFAGRDLMLEREIAIKVWYRVVDDKASRAIPEARKLASLSHPNLLPIYGLGVADKTVFATMELVRGNTLAEWLLDSHSKDERWDAWNQYFRGMSFIYERGLLHGDPHTSNVLVSGDRGLSGSMNTIKIADMGTSALWHDKRKFSAREADILLETVGRLYSEVNIADYAQFPADLHPAIVLKACNAFVRLANLDSDTQPSSAHCMMLVNVILGCPFLILERFFEYMRPFVPEHLAREVIPAAISLAAICIGHSEKQSQDEQWSRAVMERYRQEWINDQSISWNVPFRVLRKMELAFAMS
jgi:serine/threonine protein kinase